MSPPIVRAKIHPSIGVARVGNASSAFFVGPEVTSPPDPEGGYRDESGAIKRQAARFRLYGYGAHGEVVRELTPDNAEILWSAHLVNRKPEWFRFDRAMDIPEAVHTKTKRRNAQVSGADRAQLVIDPGAIEIVGKCTQGEQYRFDKGTFQGQAVPLGELQTDAAGRLLVLGGHGKSGSPTNAPIYDPKDPASFNNADGWYDDTSDGPVKATVQIDGVEVPVDPAWVIVTPPDFSPHTVSWRSMYDMLTDAFVESGRLSFPAPVSFTRDVLPVLRRMTELQWVNAGFAAMFDKEGALWFDDERLLSRLASTDPSNEESRRAVFNSFRPPVGATSDRRPWPWIYGDAFGTEADASPRQNLPLSKTRTSQLELWVQGRHIDDYDPAQQPIAELDELPLGEQPAMLDEAALTYCIADAFHPGCEVTWPMRHASMYSEPYRIRHRAANDPEPTYQAELDQAQALATDGPLYGQQPGDLTRWMALPWQADTAFCRSGYDPTYDPYLPTFWPARVPNQTLTPERYAIAIDETRSRAERLEAFRTRDQWLRALIPLPGVAAMQYMVDHFGQQGIIVPRPGVQGDPDLPPQMFVEEGGPPIDEEVSAAAEPSARAAAAASPHAARAMARQDRLRRAGWASEAQLEEFQQIRRRGRRG